MGLILTVLLLAQAGLLLLARHEIEIPDTLIDRAIEEFVPKGVKISIKRATIRQLSVLSIDEISISNATGTELLSARRAVVSFDWRKIAVGDFLPRTFFLDDATLRCPASRSTTGASEDVLTHCRIWLSRERGNVVDLRTVQGYFADTPILIGGDFPYWRSKLFLKEHVEVNEDEEEENHFGQPTTPATTETDVLAAISEVAESMSQAKQKLVDAGISKDLLVEITIDALGNGDAEVEVQIYCKSIASSDYGFSANGLSVTESGVLDVRENDFRTASPLKISAREAKLKVGEGLFDEWNLATKNVEIFVPVNFKAKDLQEILPKKVIVRANDISGENFLQGSFLATGPIVEIESPDFQKHEIIYSRANLVFAGTPISLDAEYSPDGIKANFSCEPDMKEILAIPQVAAALPDDAKWLHLRDFITAKGNVDFSPDLEFRKAEFQVDTGAADWRMVRATSLHCHGSVTSNELNIGLAQVRGKNFCSNATVATELNSHGKYRIQAFGTIDNPDALDDYLGWFWWRIWVNLKRAPSEVAPRADVDVYGTWDRKDNWERIYGCVVGENALGGGDFLVEKVRLRFAEEPTFIAAFDMGFEKGKDVVSGTLQWNYVFEPKYYFRDFRFFFSGSMSPNGVFKVVGEGLPDTVGAILNCESSAKAEVMGYVSGDAEFYPEQRVYVEVRNIEAPGEFSVFGVGLSDFSGKISFDMVGGSAGLDLAGVNAKLGEGRVGGTINIMFPTPIQAEGTLVSFSAQGTNIKKGDLLDVFYTVSAAARGAEEKAKEEEEKPVAHLVAEIKESGVAEPTKDHSKLDFELKSGKVMIPDPDSLVVRGGRYTLEDPELLALPIFGGFSEFLEKTMNISSVLEFNQSSGDFTVANGIVDFQGLKISGKTFQVDVDDADYNFVDDEISGHAVFYNKRGVNLPLVGSVIGLLSKSTKILRISVSGTLNDVNWNFGVRNPGKTIVETLEEGRDGAMNLVKRRRSKDTEEEKKETK